MNRPTTIKLPALGINVSAAPLRTRGRSGSIVKVEQIGDGSVEEVLDRSAYVNINADWVNAKGAWLIHVVLICLGKLIIDTVPGMTQQISWTLLSYLMFHWVTGIPFENDLHGGAYDDLTLWEQIDDGAQYTPAKKWLLSVPVVLFLASTHYTNYNPWLFAINITALVFVLIPKLPQLHRQRVRFMQDEPSGMATPITPMFSSGASTPLGPRDITEAHFQ
ncbi:Orm1 type endoplasmic reticulum protein [Mycena belliarum]|uniref:Orm1 type endoplasmic reticulum protein n=1 Tax=Mycena belliarum TaxID=1033014 RepID=A0AAD6UH61_9AGAR|nr:Orm1 type endoplasmic reticulum protein [Mycena belliae]